VCQFFLDAILALPALIAYIDPDLNYQYVNSAFEKWFGFTAAQCLRSNMVDIIGEAAVSVAKPYLDKALRGETQRFERESLTINGSLKCISVAYLPDLDPSGKVLGLIAIVHDITELKVTKIKLLESENYLRVVLNSVQQGVWGLDKNGSITIINDSGAKMLGYSNADEVIGKSGHSQFHHTRPDGSTYPVGECPMHSSISCHQ
jgi:PAS domain S-box-containing protein